MNHQVLIRRIEEYDREAIERIVAEGMRTLGYQPSGKVFVKPNVVFAGLPEIYGTLAYTDRALVGASLRALSKTQGVSRVDLGEKSGMGWPTRYCYKYTGYYDEIAGVRSQAPCPVDIFCMDEDLRDTIFIGGKVHDNFRVSRRMNRADSKVYLPKLKGHCVCNMTAAVKLNIGICSDDERSVRHDFLLNEKIVDLLTPGYPDFVIMDAIDVGVGNEVFPGRRKLGLILMSRNPVAADMVAARLMGYKVEDIPYLKIAIERGYQPKSLEEIKLLGDITAIEGLDEQAKRILPYDDDFYAWQDVNKELKRLNCPMRLIEGPYRQGVDQVCRYGCVMGLKMFLGGALAYAGPEAFAKANPVVFVCGRIKEEIDARGEFVFFLGSCTQAKVKNARKIIRLDKCFITATDMVYQIGPRMGLPSPASEPKLALPVIASLFTAIFMKTIKLRYLQDVGYFFTRKLTRKV